MKTIALTTSISLAALAVPAQAVVLGPTPYLSQADSPFNPASFSAFYLDDLEDNALNTPGVTATGPGICITGPTSPCFTSIIDSVGNGGNQFAGHSLWASGSITLTFSGTLPVAAGLVWTDGVNNITFQAFDQNGVSLGQLVGTHADGNFSSGTGEDRFYGATNAGGISRLVISDPGGIEIDHVQYGYQRLNGSVPEPASWAMMIGGLAVVGMAMRRRKVAVSFA
jgi:hypothetical protein